MKTITKDIFCLKCGERIAKKDDKIPFGNIKIYCSKYHETFLVNSEKSSSPNPAPNKV